MDRTSNRLSKNIRVEAVELVNVRELAPSLHR